jgi:probable phosphomutase (TIGR03848 family)
MATVILVRHGRSTANTSGLLAGRQKGIRLDETGRAQASAAAERLAAVRLAEIVSSPLERCRDTALVIAGAQRAAEEQRLRVTRDRGLVEADYGDWAGRTIKELRRDKLWTAVQAHPAAAGFPGGETLAAMAARVVTAVRRRDAALTATHGEDAVWVAVSHGDPIKAVLADALGLHLDLFQRIQVDPGSLSIVRYTSARPYVIGMNTHAGDLSWLNPPKRGRRRSDDGPVGGGAGPDPAR